MEITAEIDTKSMLAYMNFILALPKEIELASYRTLKKTLAWSVTQVARKLAEENQMPVGIFKNSVNNKQGFRSRQSKLRYGSTHGQLWIGANLVKARFLGKARRTAKGVTVGSGNNRRFYADEPGAPIRLVDRPDGRPSILFLNKNHRWESIKEPVWTTSVDDIQAEIPPRVISTMDSELNYILNHAQTVFQQTGKRA